MVKFAVEIWSLLPHRSKRKNLPQPLCGQRRFFVAFDLLPDGIVEHFIRCRERRAAVSVSHVSFIIKAQIASASWTLAQ